MTPELTVAALENCEGMLNEIKSSFAVRYAGLFAKYIAEYPQKLLFMHQLSNAIGMPANVEPWEAPLHLVGPTSSQVRRCIRSMFDRMPGMEDLSKRGRWAGFAAGAAAAVGCHAGTYLVSDQSGGWDLLLLLTFAQDAKHPRHHFAHIALGYMQGWLWAFGKASIDDFRVMINPDPKRTVSA